MRKRLIIRKDEKGVSPVIATILMVAITVVLAAVLYVMVTGLLNPSATQPPTIDLVEEPAGPANAWDIRVTVDRAVALTAFAVSLKNETTGSTCIAVTDLSATFTATCSTGVVLSYSDVAGPNQLSTGDEFRLTGVATGQSYTINLVWKASSGVVAQELLP